MYFHLWYLSCSEENLDVEEQQNERVWTFLSLSKWYKQVLYFWKKNCKAFSAEGTFCGTTFNESKHLGPQRSQGAQFPNHQLSSAVPKAGRSQQISCWVWSGTGQESSQNPTCFKNLKTCCLRSFQLMASKSSYLEMRYGSRHFHHFVLYCLYILLHEAFMVPPVWFCSKSKLSALFSALCGQTAATQEELATCFTCSCWCSGLKLLSWLHHISPTFVGSEAWWVQDAAVYFRSCWGRPAAWVRTREGGVKIISPASPQAGKESFQLVRPDSADFLHLLTWTCCSWLVESCDLVISPWISSSSGPHDG